MKSERFTYHAPDPVASHRIANRPCAHGHAEASVAKIIRQVMDAEVRIADTLAGLARLLELCRAAELLGGLES